MSRSLVILRPQPGADISAARARDLGLAPIVHPIFRIEPVSWSIPDVAYFDALMLTSANAVRQAGPQLMKYTGLPLWCVGKATAKAAEQAGLSPIQTGDADGYDLAQKMQMAGVRHALHLCGRDVRPLLPLQGLIITQVPVYASVEQSDGLNALLPPGSIILVHSPRAGEVLDNTVSLASRAMLTLITISAQARMAAGQGWAGVHVALAPNDGAMLAIAAQLCHG